MYGYEKLRCEKCTGSLSAEALAFLPPEVTLHSLVAVATGHRRGVVLQCFEAAMGEMESAENSYIIRPNFQHKFRAAPVKECIKSILKEELGNKQYVAEEVPQLTRFLSETIKDKLKEMGFDRYKMVVQAVIGEQRGEGVKMAARCFWDADTDNYAEYVFTNDYLFCVVAAFGCFYY